MTDAFQTFVTSRDGVKLNTFVYLSKAGAGPFPVILQRTPYGITKPQGVGIHDPACGWLPDPVAPMRGSILRNTRVWQKVTHTSYETPVVAQVMTLSDH